jgi:hypothetical protein
VNDAYEVAYQLATSEVNTIVQNVRISQGYMRI